MWCLNRMSTGIALLPILLIWKASAQNQASFAANVFPITSGENPIRYHALIINRGNALNQNDWKLRIPSGGLYLTTTTAGHAGNGYATYYYLYRGGSLQNAIYRSTDGVSNGLDTLGVDIISSYSAGEEIHMGNRGSHLQSTTSGLLTSWSTFSLSTEMGTKVGFGVYRMTSYSAGQLTFPLIWANVGGGWNTNTNEFEVSTAGIYFFSFMAGLGSSQQANFRIRVNGQDMFNIYRSFPTPFTWDTIGRAAMIHLYSGDRVSVYSEAAGFSDHVIRSNLNGFLYDTSRNERAAWAVYRRTGILGYHDPLPFTDIMVNEGGAWFDNIARCPFSGIYYLHISVGVQANSPVLVTIMVDAVPVGELRRDNTGFSGIDTMSRSVLVECQAGETIRITTSSNTYLYSDDNFQIGFLGFYLFQ